MKNSLSGLHMTHTFYRRERCPGCGGVGAAPGKCKVANFHCCICARSMSARVTTATISHQWHKSLQYTSFSCSNSDAFLIRSLLVNTIDYTCYF